MSYPKKVTIVESCPRDGWQSYKKMIIPTEMKIDLIKRIIDAGAERVDAISIPNPKIIPQMADAEIVLQEILPYAKAHGCTLIVGYGQKKRWENIKNMGLQCFGVGCPVSEEHSRLNYHRSIAEGMANYREMIRMARDCGVAEIRSGMNCVFGSPHGDVVSEDTIRRVCEMFMEEGADEIGMPDTAGISNPVHTRRILQVVKEIVPVERISVHFHDVQGMGLANLLIALDEGVTRVDTSLAGMGGCPFVKEAKGNIATEDAVNMLTGMGIETNWKTETAIALANEIAEKLSFTPTSSMATVQSCCG